MNESKRMNSFNGLDNENEDEDGCVYVTRARELYVYTCCIYERLLSYLISVCICHSGVYTLLCGCDSSPMCVGHDTGLLYSGARRGGTSEEGCLRGR